MEEQFRLHTEESNTRITAQPSGVEETPAPGEPAEKAGRNLWAEVKEIWQLFIRLRVKELIFDSTDNGMLQFLRYGITAVLSTVVDFLGLYLGTLCGLHYLIGTAIGYIGGIFVTYALTKWLVFKGKEARVGNTAELMGHVLIGIIALALTELLMWVCTDLMHIHYMVSKVIATVLVFFWNYYARKIILYK